MRIPLPLAQIFLSGLNHLLTGQPELAESLRRYAGRQLRIQIKPPADLPGVRTLTDLQTDARIDDDGHLVVVSAAREPAVTLTVAPTLEAVLGLWRHGAAGLTGHLRIEGDVILAAAIGDVLRRLQWDFEEDLSRVVGDVAAHRIGEGVRTAAQEARELGGRAHEAWVRHAAAPDGLLMVRAQQDEFSAELASLERRIAALEGRAGRLTGA